VSFLAAVALRPVSPNVGRPWPLPSEKTDLMTLEPLIAGILGGWEITIILAALATPVMIVGVVLLVVYLFRRVECANCNEDGSLK